MLREHGEEVALGLLSFRLVAGVLVFVATVVLVVLLALREGYVEAAAGAEDRYLTIGELLRRGRNLINRMAMILALALGAIPSMPCSGGRD